MMAAGALPFAKCTGLGNDFLVVRQADLDALGAPLDDLSRRLCSRPFGVGADGVVAWAPGEEADRFLARIFNSDGSEAESSGNGLRCLGAALRSLWAAPDAVLRIQAGGAEKALEPLGTSGTLHRFRSCLGIPRFDPESLPCLLPGPGPLRNRILEVEGSSVTATLLSLGNPHCIIRDDAWTEAQVHSLGPRLESHPIFPARVNVAFVRVLGPGRLAAGLWERGAGPTLASGTGSAAAAVAAILEGWVSGPVLVEMRGGHTRVEWDGKGEVHQEGEARFLFRGEAPIDWLVGRS